MQRNAAHTQAPAGTSAPNAQTMVGADVLDAPAVAQQTLDRTVADRPVEVDGPATPSMAAQGTGDSTAPTADRVLRYEPLRPLGEGGMGEVLLSRDRTIGRDVAVKRLKSLPGGGQAAAKDFLDEVRTTGRLEHPGIVPIYDAGWDKDGAPYFVMKYVEGEPLEQIIAKLRAGDPDYQHRFSFEVRTQIFMQLLHAMQYAHRRGVLHLDIKPANVAAVENRTTFVRTPSRTVRTNEPAGGGGLLQRLGWASRKAGQCLES